MFRITEDQSSGIFVQCLAKIIETALSCSVLFTVYGEQYTRTPGQIMLPEHRLRPCRRTR